MPPQEALFLNSVAAIADARVQDLDRRIQFDRCHLLAQLIEFLKLGTQAIADRPDGGNVLHWLGHAIPSPAALGLAGAAKARSM